MSEQSGRLRREITAAYKGCSIQPNKSDWLIADAIDRLAADVASIKATIDAVSPEDVAHLVESEKAFAELFAEQRDAAIRERDEARAEVERLNAELKQQPTAAPQPAAPSAGWLTDEERELLQSRLRALLAYLRSLCKPAPGSVTREVEIIDALLARAGSPPVVEVPLFENYAPEVLHLRYRDAMDKAGVAWKEVGRE